MNKLNDWIGRLVKFVVPKKGGSEQSIRAMGLIELLEVGDEKTHAKEFVSVVLRMLESEDITPEKLEALVCEYWVKIDQSTPTSISQKADVISKGQVSPHIEKAATGYEEIKDSLKESIYDWLIPYLEDVYDALIIEVERREED